MNATKKKIQKLSRAIAIITKIFYIIMIVIISIEAVGIIWHMISPESSFKLGNIRIISPLVFTAEDENVTNLFYGIAGQSFFTAILFTANRIFKDISHEYSPFLYNNVRRMKKIAVLLLIDSIISPSIDTAIRYSISLTSTSLSDFSSEMIVLAVVIYCFALIFQYGAELQQQSDETL